MTQLYVRTSTLDGRGWLSDRRLSWEARGAAASICAGPENPVTAELVSSWSSDDESAALAALEELAAAGYLVKATGDAAGEVQA